MSKKSSQLVSDIVQAAYMHMPSCLPDNETAFREGLAKDITRIIGQYTKKKPVTPDEREFFKSRGLRVIR